MNIYTDRAFLERQAVYPGMDPAESRVLRQYIKRRGDRFVEWRFGVRVGEGQTAPAHVDPAVRKSWQMITKARTDCVAVDAAGAVTIIEAKDVWTNEAVWQLLSYRDLYRATFPEPIAGLVGVARDASPTSRTLARNQGIALITYRLAPALPDIGEIAEEDRGDA